MEPAKGCFWHYLLLWLEEVKFLLIFNPLGKLELYRGDLGMIGVWWIIIWRGECQWQGGCCSGFREFSTSLHKAPVPAQLCQHQESAGGPHILHLMGVEKVWGEAWAASHALQESSSPPSQSLQWVGQQGFQGPLQEHGCSWVKFGPWFTPRFSPGARVLERLIVHGGNPKCHLVHLVH